MDTLTRTYRGKDRTFLVYTQAEADEQGITYAPWRYSAPGQYALTDDGYVAECLSISEFLDKSGRRKRNLTFPFGRVWDTPKARLLYEERQQSGYWHSSSGKGWVELEARKTRTKRVVKIYAQQLVEGKGVDYVALGKLYRPDQLIPEATVRRLLRLPRIKEQVDAELSALMSRSDVTPQMVIDNMRAAIELATEKRDPRNMLRGAENFARMLGMLQRRRSGFNTGRN